MQKSLRLAVGWAVRFLVQNTSGSGTLEIAYSARASDIRNGSIKDAKELLAAMQRHIPSDSLFEKSFSEANVSKAQVARYYLKVLEQQSSPEFVVTNNTDVVNLEHVLPQNPSPAWSYLDPAIVRAYYTRLGNLALMKTKVNASVGNAGFSAKQSLYLKEPFSLTRMIGNSNTWGPQEIEQRQQHLASLALTAWPNKI